MTDAMTPRVGGTLSADIAVPEHERELRFYSSVLSTGEHPLWREDLMNSLGMPVIGLGARVPEYADLPLQWMPHIQVADVAASAKRALELGGTELMHGKDDAGNSQWAVLLDPDGAAFGLIPVVSKEAIVPAEGAGGLDAKAPTGHIVWLDLTVTEAARSRDFYREVVGWSVQDVGIEAEGERYSDFRMLVDGGAAAAAVSHARGENQGLPAAWLIYLPVGDLGLSLRHVEEEGGKVVKERRGSHGELESAVIQDPVGAWLGLVPAG